MSSLETELRKLIDKHPESRSAGDSSPSPKLKIVRKYFLFVLFLCINTTIVYAEYKFPDYSSLVLKNITEEVKDNLILVEYHINRVNDKGYYMIDGIDPEYKNNKIFQEYLIYNNGNSLHKIRLGVAYQYVNQIPLELFEINDNKISHQLDIILFGYDGIRLPFAFIDIEFPAGEHTKVRINDLSYVMEYNEEEFQLEEFIFNGSPRFTATIGNYKLDYNRRYMEIEESWINDIVFNNLQNQRTSLVSILGQKDSLSNDLFTIIKVNENEWNIEFTEIFVNEHRSNLAFQIHSGAWGICEDSPPESFLFNSNERLSSYQYIFLTNKQLQIVRNAYYAKHGYNFRDLNLNRFYIDILDSCFGNINYVPNPNFHEGMLTDIDRANIETIRRLEAWTGE